MVEYRRALAAYVEARAAYETAAGAYWKLIAEKRHLRTAKRANHEQISIDDYVLTQPPVYSGPPKPRDPSGPVKNRRRQSPFRWLRIFSRPRSANSNSFRRRRKRKASSNALMQKPRWRPG